MPASYQCKDWYLGYASELHGYSLQAAYRAGAERHDACVLAVMDTNQHVFGAFNTEPIRVSGSYYGSSENFLVRIHPKFSAYKWTGKNTQFVIVSISLNLLVCLKFNF